MEFEIVFKALGESTRIKIVRLLAHKSMYVCELEAVLEMSQPRISQHLKILKHAGIVNDEKEGQRSIYSLNLDHIKSTFSDYLLFLESPLSHREDYKLEYERLCGLSDNPQIKTCKSF